MVSQYEVQGNIANSNEKHIKMQNPEWARVTLELKLYIYICSLSIQNLPYPAKKSTNVKKL